MLVLFPPFFDSNPVGRTGMEGRGLLGRWGPNHAADPIVTRWKRDGVGKVERVSGKPRLEFVAIKRRDTGDWAIPGVSCRGKGREGKGREERGRECFNMCCAFFKK